jgi:5-formyltetrahydrofolate cyclo-ligase
MHLRASQVLQRARLVLTYLSTRQEPSLTPLFALPNIVWGLPRCQEQQLSWHIYQPGDLASLEQGKYGIWEPKSSLPQISPEHVDLILVPAVACDHQGYRLGYGGGFYDRCLSQLIWQTLPTVGIVFDFAYLPALPHDTWDIPLQWVCTDRGWMTEHP